MGAIIDIKPFNLRQNETGYPRNHREKKYLLQFGKISTFMGSSFMKNSFMI